LLRLQRHQAAIRARQRAPPPMHHYQQLAPATTCGKQQPQQQQEDVESQVFGRPVTEPEEARRENKAQPALSHAQQQQWAPNAQADRRASSQTFLRDLRAAEQFLRAKGLERVPIRGDDNNCQFRTLAAFYNHANVTHSTIRHLIVEYIEQHADQFRLDIELGLGYASLEQYCAEMRQSGTWGDGVTLMAFALMQNVNIEVCTASGFTELFPGPSRPKMAVVCVGEHYEATRRIETVQQSAKTLAAQVVEPSPQKVSAAALV